MITWRRIFVGIFAFWLTLAWAAAPGARAATLSAEEERKIGKEVKSQISKQYQEIDDPYLDQYLKNIATRLGKAMPRLTEPVRMHVLKDPTVNAFAIPGGDIYFTTGVLLAMADEEELAGVMAHEMGHIAGRHIALRMERGNEMQFAALGVLLAAILLGASSGGEMAAAATAFGVSALETQMLKYSRSDETDADLQAQAAMEKAGYSSWGMVRFMEELRRRSGIPEDFPTYLLTHPMPELRADQLAARADEETPRLDPSAGEFWIAQAHVLDADPKPWGEELFVQRAAEHPDSLSAQLAAGHVFRSLGRFRRADEALGRAAFLAPQNTRVRHERAMLALQQGKAPEGLALLEELKNSGDAAILRDLLWAQIETGKAEEALETVEELARLDPDWPELPYHRGIALGKAGKQGLAHAELGRYYLDRDPTLAEKHLRDALDRLPPGPVRETVAESLRKLVK